MQEVCWHEVTWTVVRLAAKCCALARMAKIDQEEHPLEICKPLGHKAMEGNIFLDPGWSGGKVYLVNAYTGERALLPQSNEGDQWSLAWAHNKMAYLRLNGVTWKWVTKVFKANVMQDSNGVDFVTSDHQSYTPLSQYMLEYDLVTVKLNRGEGTCKQMCEHNCLLMHHSCSGAFLWWSVPDLYKAWGLGGAKVSVAKNIEHRWNRWENVAKSMGLGPCHLRKPEVTNHLANDNPERHNLERLVEFPSVSTHLLVGLLSRWAFCKIGCGGMHSAVQKQASLDALTALLHVGAEQQSFILLSPSAVWEPPLQPRASDGVLVDCKNLTICFKDLLEVFPKNSWPALHLLRPQYEAAEKNSVPVLTLLRAAVEAGLKGQTVLKQLVWGLGTCIEQVLVHNLQMQLHAKKSDKDPQDLVSTCEHHMHDSALSQKDGCSSASSSSSKAPVFATVPEEKGLQDSQHKLQVFLDMYWRGARELFWQQPILSIAIDGARIARKAILLAAVAKPSGEAAWAPPQVNDDYMGEASLAILDGDAEVIEERKQAWTRTSEAWTEGGAAKPERKRQRTKAYQWLLAVESILQQYTGSGISRYILHSEKEKRLSNPMDWPWLGVSLDRGPDSWAAKQFAKYFLHVNWEEFPDQSHDNWNDVRGALRETGLWTHVLVMVLILNLSHGPFSEGKWHDKLTAAFLEYHSLASARDPVFLWLLPRILSGQGQLHRLCEKNIAQEVWDSLPEAWCWHKRGDKVGMCRFFGYVKGSGPYQCIFHIKLLGMIYLGIQEGWLTKAALTSAKKIHLKTKTSSSDHKKTSMKDSNADVTKLFKLGNSLQVVTLAKLDPDTYFIQDMVMISVRPLLDWHSTQNKALRSCSGAREWLMQQTSGEFLKPLCDIFANLWDESRLHDTGFAVNEHMVPVSGLQPVNCNHPFMVEQGARAGTMMVFHLNLTGSRIRRFFWALRGWPTQSCLLGHSNAEKRNEIIERLKADYNNWKTCSEKSGYFCRKGQSVFETAPVEQIIEIMKRRDWKDSPDMQAWTIRKYSSLIQTQLVEDGFQRERSKENKSAAKSFNCATAWHTVINKKVLTTIHKFKKFQLKGSRRGQWSKHKKQALYRPSARKASCNLRRIISKKTGTAEDWWTCNSSTWNAPFAHLVLQEYCVADPTRFTRVHDSWLCILFRDMSVLVRAVGTEQWFFSLGDVAEVVGIGWPAIELKDKFGTVVGYLPQKDLPANPLDLIKYFPTTVVWPAGESEYEAMPFKAHSPLAMKLLKHTDLECKCLAPKAGSQPVAAPPASSSSGPLLPVPHKLKGVCIAAVPTMSKPEPLLKVAAHGAFGQMGVGRLKELAKHLKVAVYPSDKLIDILVSLLKFILAPLDEEVLIEVLALREFKRSPLEDILQSDEIVEQFDNRDQAEIEKDKEEGKAHKVERKEYKAKLKDMRKEFRRKVLADKKLACKNRARYKNPLTREERQRLPTNVVPGVLRSDIVQSMAPPGCKVWHDEFSGRWQVTLDNYTKSRSWLKYGHTESAYLVLAKAWERFMELYGLTACPVKGLLEQAAEIEKSAKSKLAVSVGVDADSGSGTAAGSATASVSGTAAGSATGSATASASRIAASSATGPASSGIAG